MRVRNNFIFNEYVTHVLISYIIVGTIFAFFTLLCRFTTLKNVIITTLFNWKVFEIWYTGVCILNKTVYA